MSAVSERQYNPKASLWCDGCERTYAIPDVHGADGVNGSVLCDECGKPVELVGIVCYGEARWESLDYERRRAAQLLTEAKLHPVSLLAAMRAEGSKP